MGEREKLAHPTSGVLKLGKTDLAVYLPQGPQGLEGTKELDR